MWAIDKSLNWGRFLISEFSSLVPQAQHILDVGAGWGDDLLTFKKNHPASELHAIECHSEATAKLKSLGIKTYEINFESEPIPLGEEICDVVISNQVLEHCKEIFWSLHEMSRTLRVGGHLIIGTPNLASLHNRLLLAVGLQPTCIQNSSAHIRGYTFRDLIRFLNIFPGGFELIARRGSNFYPFPPSIAKPLAQAFPSLAWSMFLLLRKTKKYDQPYFLEHPKKQRLETKFYLGSLES
ncbi:class I SAM-dependent methyltransferase [bacterium]|nr:class I SAM-dependent methyltransferase [bacterium]